MASTLSDVGLSPDAAPISQAASQCRAAIKVAGSSQPDAGREYWGYQIDGLKINLEDQRHLRPRSTVMQGARGVLAITVHEYVPQNENEIGDSYALLRQFNTDFYVDAVQIIEDREHPLRAAWHLDTHLYSTTVSRSSHPRFHIQIGGERLDEIDDRIRGVLVPEAPRIPCAPFEAILAVDFVLSQYCGEMWDLLREDRPSYTRLRKVPMQRFWSPYFRTLADCIDGLDTDPGGGSACGLIPNIFSVRN